MKKTILAVALSGVATTAAYAQSSVTLYGLIDSGITYTNNEGGHSNWSATDGMTQGSRFGLTGSEDLGGGLKAVFRLENGFSLTNGNLAQNNRAFGRQAYVGLSSDQAGTVTLGRQYDDVVDYLGPLALTGTQYGGTEFAHPFDNDNLANSFRINNSVKYQSANYGGLKFGALYGFSNSSDGFSNNRAYSVGTSYNYGGLNVAAAYMQLNNDPNNLQQAVSDPGAVTGDATFAAGRQRTWGAGVNYAFGRAHAGFVFTQTRLDNAVGINAANAGTTGNLALNGDARFNNYEINARYQLTPALNVAAAYTYTSGSMNGASPKWQQVGLQSSYALSKRTDIYLQGVYQHVSTDGLNIGANINGMSASSNNKQVAVTTGIRHRF